jgi:hypothetical protein
MGNFVRRLASVPTRMPLSVRPEIARPDIAPGVFIDLPPKKLAAVSFPSRE